MVVRVQTAAVLSRLACPNLERLHIKVSFSSVLIFSGASLPSLRTLCLTDVTLVECSLDALPSLRSLSLMFCATFALPLGLESLFVQGDRRLSLDAIVRVSATLEKIQFVHVGLVNPGSLQVLCKSCPKLRCLMACDPRLGSDLDNLAVSLCSECVSQDMEYLELQRMHRVVYTT